jgi:hypothetical protein
MLIGITMRLPELFGHKAHSSVIRGVDLVQFVDVVTTACAANTRQIRVVVQAEVLEGTEQVAFEGVPEADLDADVAVEVVKDVFVVGPLRRRREPEQNLRAQMTKELFVSTRSRAMKLVDDDDIEGVRRHLREIHPGQGLDRAEHVAPLGRHHAVHIELAEIAGSQHLPERREALFEDLLPVRNEQQPRIAPELLAKPPVVESGDNRLSRFL